MVAGSRVGVIVVLLSLIVWSCQQGPTVSTTSGDAVVECDESVLPTMEFQAKDFHTTYPEATIHIRSVEAREAVVNFLNDSIRVIVLGREFNSEELDFIKRANIDYQGFKVALDAVVVIVNNRQRDTTLRITELDSIYAGFRMKWNKADISMIGTYIGDINSSVNEVFAKEILNGKPWSLAVVRMKSSAKIIDEVKDNTNGIGLVGLSWLAGHEGEVKVCRLGGGSYQPDTAVVPGQFFSPAQAHVLRKYYPISREVYMYTREPRKDVSYGFIAYVKDSKGQKNFVTRGLVPATLPVRIVNLTADKVHEQ